MGRVLTVSRASVVPAHQAEYVRTVHLLAELCEARGQRLWLFAAQEGSGRFVEFSESRTELAHRVRASRTDLEQKLERRLREIAQYEPGAWDLWDEVPAPAPDDAEEPQ